MSKHLHVLLGFLLRSVNDRGRKRLVGLLGILARGLARLLGRRLAMIVITGAAAAAAAIQFLINNKLPSLRSGERRILFGPLLAAGALLVVASTSASSSSRRSRSFATKVALQELPLDGVKVGAGAGCVLEVAELG